MPLSESQVLDALRSVQDPDLHRDIVALGFIKDLSVDGDRVAFKVELTTPACPVKDLLRDQCIEVVEALGASQVSVEMTAQVRSRENKSQELIPDVKNCIAIASGKGGVGKSTVTINLAIALAQTGARVGIMDADVYGPSIPQMMGCQGDRPMTLNSKILPVEKFGIKMMSLGFLLEEGQTVMWRGPMVAGTVKQLLEDVEWGELDYLLVDLPPGTGDAPMSLAQLAPLAGVAIVTTPHHVAANIAANSVQLFRRLNAPILGVVENMAGYICPGCGTVNQIFAGLPGEELAQRVGVPYLGSIPLDSEISAGGDTGKPSLLLSPESRFADSFKTIAGKLAQQISIRAVTSESVQENAFKPVEA